MDTSADSNNSFYRNNSGGRLRSLHLTSAENPFTGQQPVTVGIAIQQRRQQHGQQQHEQQQLSDVELLCICI